MQVDGTGSKKSLQTRGVVTQEEEGPESQERSLHILIFPLQYIVISIAYACTKKLPELRAEAAASGAQHSPRGHMKPAYTVVREGWGRPRVRNAGCRDADSGEGEGARTTRLARRNSRQHGTQCAISYSGPRMRFHLGVRPYDDSWPGSPRNKFVIRNFKLNFIFWLESIWRTPWRDSGELCLCYGTRDITALPPACIHAVIP